jgi:tRNA(Ile)-lysidine synthase
MSLSESIRAFLDRLPAGRPGLVVAVSGGADSVAQLRALDSLQVGPLVIAHLNHRLRGAESDADEQFVRDLPARLTDVRLAVRRAEVGAIAAEASENLEAVARRERYRFLADVAIEHGIGRVATAHTANDQAETVLHRLIRGTGLQGLRGIATRRRLCPGVELIRPMLDVTRTEVLEYLAELGQPYRDDRSNLDVRFTRNRIRHELLPLLESSYNPNIVMQLCRVAKQATESFSAVRRQARQLLRACELPPAGMMRVLDAERLRAAPRDLRREALRQLWQREGWSRDRMRYTDWDRLAAVAADELTAVDLPGKIHARRRGRVLQIGPAASH